MEPPPIGIRTWCPSVGIASHVGFCCTCGPPLEITTWDPPLGIRAWPTLYTQKHINKNPFSSKNTKKDIISKTHFVLILKPIYHVII